MSKKIFRVKFEYIEHFYLEKELKIPCFGSEYGDFFFNWSTETANQFMNHIMSIQPTKFYISSTSEVEGISSKIELFQKIMMSYNKTGNKKIDKFELISIIPFIVCNNYENALSISLNYFCLENEDFGILTKIEFGFFLDSLFTSLHNILILDDNDNLYSTTKNHIIKLGEEEIDKISNQIYQSLNEIEITEIITKLPDNLKKIFDNINKGLNQTLKYYEKKIKNGNIPINK